MVHASAISSPAGIPVSVQPSQLTLNVGQSGTLTFSAPPTYTSGLTQYDFNYWWINGEPFTSPTANYTVTCQQGGTTINVEGIANYTTKFTVSKLPWSTIAIGAAVIVGAGVLAYVLASRRKKE